MNSTINLIDSHCHLDDPRLYERRTAIISAALEYGVEQFIVPGIEPQRWQRIISLSAENPRIFAALGVHPQYAATWNHENGAILRRVSSELVAVGEIGLDYSPGMPAAELQQEVFRAQLRIAKEAALPVIIHCRSAFADTLRILAEERVEKFGGVMHAFSGSVETARAFIALGLKIGVAGPATWSNALKPVKVVKEISLQELLLETDSPDLSPQSHRGTINQPAFLPEIACKVAAIKGLSVDLVAAVTTENAKTLFRIT